MTQIVKIKETWYEVLNGESVPVFVAGQFYAVDERTMRQVEIGNGELVDAPEDADKAQAAADAAQAAAEKAAAKADAATAAAEAAQAAAAVVETPAA